MITSKLKVGGECISYCTKCRMDLVHRIIAMVGGVPVKVECESCHSHHRYRRPMEERGADTRRAAAASSTARSAASPSPRSASGRAAAAVAEEVERERLWASRIAGKGTGDFVKYTPKGSFKEDDLVQHFKFGDGFVMRVIDSGKIEVLFRDGPRILAQGL